MTKPNPNEATRFKEGNQIAQRHGGEGAIVKLRTGEPFLNLALEAQRQVEAALGVNLDGLSGVDALLVEDACRLEATARLFQAAAYGAAESGDLVAWERFCQRLGWITGKAFAALLEVRKMLASRQDATIDDAIREASGVTDR